MKRNHFSAHRRYRARRLVRATRRFAPLDLLVVVPCVRCGAGPNQPCITPDGNIVPSHAARRVTLQRRLAVVAFFAGGGR